ncbi:DUF397 domain-containing protein [Streptomyces sp. SID8352]|nr:DUF397 domain-containing protein [Streptomyces sp. SID8352]MYU23437.1 DUF397 domain-containing protein [Streptomyces sp. SID8352]
MNGGAGNRGCLTWRKSSFSNPDGGECVEVADGVPGVVPVRDSKDPGGAVLLVPAYAWTHFLASLPAG